jgi:hypothetical protein
MDSIWRLPIIRNVVIALLLMPTVGLAADFELFWDPNCNQDPTLEGYYIYYKEDASVIVDPGGAVEVYVDLSDSVFDPDEPGFTIADLLDDTRYCFAVAAWYGDEESEMSNEVCGINGAYYWDPANSPVDPGDSSTENSSTSNSSGGCFIGTLSSFF